MTRKWINTNCRPYSRLGYRPVHSVNELNGDSIDKSVTLSESRHD